MGVCMDVYVCVVMYAHVCSRGGVHHKAEFRGQLCGLSFHFSMAPRDQAQVSRLLQMLF